MRVAIADDTLLIREGIARILTAHGIDVVLSVGDIDQLLRAIDDEQPEIAILDIRMPPTYRDEGVRASRELAATHPDLGVLILSQYRAPAYATALLETTAARRGYLLKETILDADQLIGALYRILAGQTVVDPAVIDAALVTADRNDRLRALSARELDVLALLAQGLTDRGICDRLVLSPRTVASHVQHIFSKLALPEGSHDNRRVHAVLAYLARS